MKLMYALWGAGLAPVLCGPQARAAIRAAGATQLQVNVDDAEVAAAKLRISTFDAPVKAVVSVWADGDPAPISAVLAGLGERCAGWEVEERTPLVPPATPDGERCPALAQVVFLRIPAGLDPAQWLRLWQGEHTSVAIETQATFGYVQNRVLRPVLGAERVDALVEELFPMAAMSDVHVFYGSGGDEAELKRRLDRMIGSVTRFGADRDLDVVPTSRYAYPS